MKSATTTPQEHVSTENEPLPGWRLFRKKSAHLITFWFVIWPILSAVFGAMKLMDYPATAEVPPRIAYPGVAIGVLYLIPEFLVSATALSLLSVAVFALMPLQNAKRNWFFEPAMAYVGLCLGISLEFPAVLNHPFFWPLRSTTLFGAYAFLVLLLVAFGALRHGVPCAPFRYVRAFAPVVCFVFLGWLITQVPVWGPHSSVNRRSTVILGIDSVGAQMEIGQLRRFSIENGGAWYEKAITPGLLTNAVWSAIFEHRPVHETGVVLIFQSADWSRSPYQLVSLAKRRGYQTWSFFTGQNTIYVGSTGGFDHDRSGPMGWLQDATASAKDGSILVPFLVSRLPQLPFARITQNQAGTYAYDLRAVFRGILRSHEGDKPVFAVSHIGYLHDEAYPRFAELPKGTRWLLMGAKVKSLQDFGGEWQVRAVPGDRLNLRQWKFNNIQAVITKEIRNSGFLDPRNGNALVLLSDHGMRTDVTNENFGSETYYHVPLITFGLPVRDLNRPISLLDVPGLVGLEDESRPGPSTPAVEYINFSGTSDYRDAILSAEWRRDGRIDIRAEIAQKMVSKLKPYYPEQNVVRGLENASLGSKPVSSHPEISK